MLPPLIFKWSTRGGFGCLRNAEAAAGDPWLCSTCSLGTLQSVSGVIAKDRFRKGTPIITLFLAILRVSFPLQLIPVSPFIEVFFKGGTMQHSKITKLGGTVPHKYTDGVQKRIHYGLDVPLNIHCLTLSHIRVLIWDSVCKIAFVLVGKSSTGMSFLPDHMFSELTAYKWDLSTWELFHDYQGPTTWRIHPSS